MGFSALITAFYEARGVVFDSLTFESLSLAINLTYIRKNYWNPADLSITFLRSRKAKARTPAEAPPVAPPPPRLSVSPFSSTPLDQIIPMLQSIHHGQCLVIQSIHHLSQQQPVISLQDFLEQVAWHGVLTSLVGGGGEALEAQDPAGETDKADACAADAEMAQDPIDEADDADVGAIDAEMDADYVADVTSAQGAWDPWPTQDRVAGLGLYLLPLHYRHFIFIMVL